MAQGVHGFVDDVGDRWAVVPWHVVHGTSFMMLTAGRSCHCTSCAWHSFYDEKAVGLAHDVHLMYDEKAMGLAQDVHLFYYERP